MAKAPEQPVRHGGFVPPSLRYFIIWESLFGTEGLAQAKGRTSYFSSLRPKPYPKPCATLWQELVRCCRQVTELA